MGAALGNVRQTSEKDDVCTMIHIAFENKIVPVSPRWAVLHVALVILNARWLVLAECTAEVIEPVAQLWMQHDIWSGKNNMLKAAGKGWRQHTHIP